MKIIQSFLLAVAVFLSSTALASAFYVDNNGSVGINTTSPQAALDIVGSLYSRLISTTGSSTPTVNWSQGNTQSVTLTSNTTFAFTNGQAGGTYGLILKQDGTGGRSVTWPSGIKWPAGDAPTLTSAANSTDLVNFVYDGTDYLGYYYLDYQTARAHIAFDNAAYSTPGSASSQTLPFTVGSGSNRLLLVWAYAENSTSITGVTYNGTSMTLLTSEQMQYTPHTLYLFYLVNPSAGTHNIIATNSGTSYMYVSGASYSGVDQSSPIDVYGATHSTSGTNSVSVNLTTTVANDWISMGGRLDNAGTPGVSGVLSSVLGTPPDAGDFIGDTSGELSTGSHTATLTSSIAGGTVGIAAAISPAP